MGKGFSLHWIGFFFTTKLTNEVRFLADSRSDFELRSRWVDRVETASPIRYGNGGVLASGGYPWIVIPVVNCRDYMNALEAASVSQNIIPLTQLIAGLVSAKD